MNEKHETARPRPCKHHSLQRSWALAISLLAVIAVVSIDAGSAASVNQPAAGNTFTQPLWSVNLGSDVTFTSPAFATIEGVRAIVTASTSGDIYVVNAVTGKELPGWPRAVYLKGTGPVGIDSSPVVAYLDGPQHPPTIVVGLGSKHVPNQNGGVAAYNANGTERWIYPSLVLHQTGVTSPYTDEVFATPAIGDIEGNGQEDVVWGGFDHHLYAVTASGHLVPGFPVNLGDSVWASAALVDVDHNGQDDIILGQGSYDVTGPNGRPCHGGLDFDYAWSAKTQATERVWENCTPESIMSSAAIGVLNSGSANPLQFPAAVFGTSFDPEDLAAANVLYAVYTDSGKALPGWPVKAPGVTFGSPDIGELTPGGPSVIVSAECPHCSTVPPVGGSSEVTEWSADGHQDWTVNYNVNPSFSSPILANVTGSGPEDVLVGAIDGLMILNGQTGQYIDNTGVAPLDAGCRIEGAPAISAVKGVSSGYELVFNCFRASGSTLVAYPLPAAPDQSLGWSSWRAGGNNTGVPVPASGGKLSCAVPAAPAAYRVLRADGKILTFGNLQNCGGLSTQVLPSPAVSIASTSNGAGYLVALADGAVYAFGNATWRGDGMHDDWTGPSTPPGAPIVSIGAVVNGSGYYLLDGEGHVYGFGAGAPYKGSPASVSGTPVSLVTNPSGRGYWVVTSNGTVYSYGGAPDLASVRGPTAVVGAAATADGKGLWIVSSNGEIHTTGDAHSKGQPRQATSSPVVGFAAAPHNTGYWMVERNGTVDAFPFPPGLKNWGSATGQSEPIVAMSAPAG